MRVQVVYGYFEICKSCKNRSVGKMKSVGQFNCVLFLCRYLGEQAASLLKSILSPFAWLQEV